MTNPNYNLPLDSFFKFSFSVDCAIYGYDSKGLKILLIQRGAQPFMGKMALPGDLVYPEENLTSAANRVLKELTGLENVYLDQFKTFGNVNRHPMGRVITVSFLSLLKIDEYNAKASSWAEKATWINVEDLPELAFDHSDIVASATSEIRKRFRREALSFELLPEKFTLTELQNIYEVVLGMKFDKGNFRKKINSTKVLRALDEMQKDVPHRPAKLFTFDRERYEAELANGYIFNW